MELKGKNGRTAGLGVGVLFPQRSGPVDLLGARLSALLSGFAADFPDRSQPEIHEYLHLLPGRCLALVNKL